MPNYIIFLHWNDCWCISFLYFRINRYWQNKKEQTFGGMLIFKCACRWPKLLSKICLFVRLFPFFSNANLTHLPKKWAKLAIWWCCLGGSSKMAPRILIFSIVLGAECSFYVKSIAKYLCLHIFGYNNSVLAQLN